MNTLVNTLAVIGAGSVMAFLCIVAVIVYTEMTEK